MQKIALFDFCETLANFQTADRYVHYTRTYYHFLPMRIMNRIYVFLHDTNIISRLTKMFPKGSVNKRFILWQLQGQQRMTLEKSAKLYYSEIIKPNLIPAVIEELLYLKSNGYKIILVSGGYDIYLKYFAKDFNIDDVISSKIKFIGNTCTGTLDGRDCLWEEKTRLLDEKFPNRQNYYFVAYSDSFSDLPLLEWADEAIVVRRKDKKIWTNKFREIVW